MKKLFKKLESKFNINSIFNIEPKIKQKTINDQSLLDTVDIYIIKVALLV